ncbi:hypothetical protein ACI1MP_31060 [Kitasatospora griseola]|uniref:hypothetical protein n=1 Tax=Kitasatospora griseola TaxID=2064 RepID=UPI003855A7AA
MSGLIAMLGVLGDTEGLEAVGDCLTERVQLPGAGKPGDLAPLAHEAFVKAFETGAGVRSAAVAVKALAVEALLAVLEIGGEEGEEARSNMADWAAHLTSEVVGSDPEGDRSTLHAMLDAAEQAMERHLQLALMLLDWTVRQTRDLGYHVTTEPDRELTARAARLLTDGTQRMADLMTRQELDEAALNLVELELHRVLYVLREVEAAKPLAVDSLRRADALLERRTGRDDRIAHLDRMLKVSRVTGDPGTVGDRVERLGEALRHAGHQEEQAGRRLEAARLYSNLAYRQFTAAEYTGVTRSYLLTVYYFEKTQALRAEHLSDPHTADARHPQAHLRFEAEGFIYGASGRLARPEAASELYDRAASAHARAAKLAFDNFELHTFYLTAACFFDAHSSLARATRAGGVPEILALLAGATGAFHECGGMFQHAFSSYEAVLGRILDKAADPCPGDRVRELSRTLHPAAQEVAVASSAVAAAAESGNPEALRAAVARLASQFIFLYPTG